MHPTLALRHGPPGFFRRSLEEAGRIARFVTSFEGVTGPTKPLPLIDFSTPGSVARCKLMSDADMGGFSTAHLDWVPASTTTATTTTTTHPHTPAHVRFHGRISTKLPPNRPEVMRSGYAGFRSADRLPSIFGSSDWDLDGYSAVAVRVMVPSLSLAPAATTTSKPDSAAAAAALQKQDKSEPEQPDGKAGNTAALLSNLSSFSGRQSLRRGSGSSTPAAPSSSPSPEWSARNEDRTYFVNIQTDSIVPTDLHQHRLFFKRAAGESSRPAPAAAGSEMARASVSAHPVLPDVWQTIVIPLSHFVRTNHGLVVEPQNEMLTTKVRSIGISTVDRLAPSPHFELRVAGIWAVNEDDDVEALGFTKAEERVTEIKEN